MAKMLDRRTFLLTGSAAAAIAFFVGGVAGEEAAGESAEFKHVLEAILNGATPAETGIVLDLPEHVENGDYVPVALEVDSPMTAENYVKAIHLLSTANPRANVATFHFTLLSGKARVTSRMRLAHTQDVVAVAELSDGRLLLTRRKVDVRIGGCDI